jgi:hypothetical protein
MDRIEAYASHVKLRRVLPLGSGTKEVGDGVLEVENIVLRLNRVAGVESSLLKIT